MRLSLSFFVAGPVVPLARPRVVHKGSRVVAFTPEKSQAYKRHVALHALNARNRLPGWRTDWARYELTVVVYRDEHAGDADNFLKVCADALIGIVFDDDRYVTEAHVQLIDCESGVEFNDEPWPVGAQVTVAMIGNEDVETARKNRARMRARQRRAEVR